MEQHEHWLEEEEEAALRVRRHRNRNTSNAIASAAASGTTSDGSLSLNPTDETRPLNKEEEEEEEEAAAAAATEEEEAAAAAAEKEEEAAAAATEEEEEAVAEKEEEEAAAAAAEKEEEAAAAEEGEKLDDAAGNEEGRFEKSIYLGKNNDTGTAFVAEGIEECRLEKSVSLDKDKDTESTNRFSGMRYSSVGCSVFEPNPEDQELDVTEKHFEIQESLSTVIKHQYEEKLNDESLSGFSLLPSERSCEYQNTSYKILNTGSIEKTDAILIKESYQEVTELDVERVLEKQETHDLYCPNCNSCITRRVILHKRKRKIGNIQRVGKRDKFKTKVDSEFEADPVYSANGKAHDTVDVCLDGGPTPAVGDYNQDREPDIFRCLACFSFFICTGDGFKLSRIFGDREENEDLQNPRQISATTTNWLFSIFASDKGKMAIEEGGDAQGVSEVDTVKQSSTPLSGGTLVNTGEPVKDAILKPQEGGLKFPVPSTAGSSMLEEPEIDQKYNMAIRNETLPYQNGHATTEPKEDGKDIVVSSKGPMFIENVTTVLEEQSVDAVENNNTGSAAQERLLEHILPDHPVTQVAGTTLVNTKEPAEDSTLKPQLGALKILSTTAVSSMLEKPKIDLSQSSDVQLGNETLPDQNESGYPVRTNTGVDVILTVEAEAVQAASSQGAQSITISGETKILTGTQINEGQQNSAEASEVQGWDILKSIVYGGLIESITSLGVVSSAAGADAATLNVLALGLANLFGGLFIIGHNLRDLKNDNSGGTSNQMNEQVDRYQELLGQRRNFILHAIVAVSSFLIFGLLPPVIYGFSFLNSDNKDLKLAAVMAASLLCIILLAIGKCYVQRPPKSYIKTVLHYVITGFMASGASYIIGSLIKKLLDKLGWFESSSAVAMPFLKTGTAKPVWASY